MTSNTILEIYLFYFIMIAFLILVFFTCAKNGPSFQFGVVSKSMKQLN